MQNTVSDLAPLLLMSSRGSIDWQSVPALETMTKIIARVTNRVFVGLPFCA